MTVKRAKYYTLVIGLCFLIALIVHNQAEAGDSYGFAELYIGKEITFTSASDNPHRWVGSCPTEIAVGYHHQFKSGFYLRPQLKHWSNFCNGYPVNNETAETVVDSVGLTIGVRF